MRNSFIYRSPLGPLTVTVQEGAVAALVWGGAGARRADPGPGDPRRDDPGGGGSGGNGPLLAGAAARWLDGYFAGTPGALPPLVPMPTDFQTRFRAALLAIPYGETQTYGDLARVLGVSAQAIGQACGANPVPIIVPCHRVLAANGLGGFSGGSGVEAKVALLRHEGAASLLI